MREQTFVTTAADGRRITVYLSMDETDYKGRPCGMVKFYDQTYTGDAPRGSQGQGFTVDGQFISSHYAEEFINKKVGGLVLDGGVPEWTLETKQAFLVWQWINLVYAGYGEQIPEYITPLGG